jgi:protein phosphatase
MGEELQLRWSSAARTDVGLLRSRNEDAVLDRPERRMWAVADGMGGHALGELASKMAVDALDRLPAAATWQQAVAEARAQLLAVNHALLEEARARQFSVIGSTLVLLLAAGRTAVCLWAGDSRIYLCRGSSLLQLTRDHNQFEDLQIRNNLSAAEAQAWPGGSMITRALGASELLELEEVQVQVSDGDVFLLCSDGLTNAVSPEDIYGVLASRGCAQAADALLALALANGGRDNISVIVARADDTDKDATLFNPALLDPGGTV